MKLKIYLLAIGGALLTFLSLMLKVKRLEKKAVETKLKHAETQLEMNAKSTEKLMQARQKGQERLNAISDDIDLGRM